MVKRLVVVDRDPAARVAENLGIRLRASAENRSNSIEKCDFPFASSGGVDGPPIQTMMASYSKPRGNPTLRCTRTTRCKIHDACATLASRGDLVVRVRVTSMDIIGSCDLT